MSKNNKIGWKNKRCRLGDLKPWERNPRQITRDEAERLVDSFDSFGQVETVAIGPNNEIYNGHQRLNVLMSKYGENYEVDVRQSSRELTEKEREKLVIYLHKGATGDWDWDMLANEFEFDELIEWGFDEKELIGHDFDAAEDGELSHIYNESSPLVYNKAQIIGAAFEHFRRTGFPYRTLPLHTCMQEINKLAQTDNDKLFETNTAYQVADTYHPHRFHARVEGKRPPIDAYNDDKLLRLALDKEVDLRGNILPDTIQMLLLVHNTQACANFRPGFACYLYKKYCKENSVVLDTSTGYGGRLIGAIASGVVSLYIGIDPNTVTHDGNLRMAQDLNFSDKIELHNLPAEDVKHEVVKGRCDFAFTSPPYFAKEKYSDDDTQSWVRYKEASSWRKGFLQKMLELQYEALKPGSYSVINIANVKIKGIIYPLERWTVEDAKKVGFEHVKTDYYNLSRRLGIHQEEGVAQEPIIVFAKPK